MLLNRAYNAAAHSTHRYLVLFGGAGSGKSVFCAQKLVARAMRVPGERFLVTRKVARTLRHSTFQLLTDLILDENIAANVRRGEMHIEFPNGSSIMHAGLDDREKLKSIAGISSIWIEEATELQEDDFTQLDLRLRGEVADYKQIMLSFNPISSLHWLKRRFVDEKPDDCHLVHTTYRDNAYIDPEYKLVLEGLSDDNLHKVYTLGQWGDLIKGLVYTNWETSTTWKTGDEWVYGLDFGYNNPTALVRVSNVDESLMVDEVLYESHLTNSDLITRMNAIGVDKDAPIYADHAEPQRLEEIERAGYLIYPADKDVNKGIDSVQRRRMFVTTESTNVLAELRSYKWSEDRDGNLIDKPVKFLDHACDAIRYAVHTRWGLPRPTTIELEHVYI